MTSVLLIPGLTCDAAFWRALIDVLPPRVTTVVPRLHDFQSIDEMAKTALSSADGDLHVIGHSMGGRVALSMYRQAPDRIASLSLLDTGAHPSDEAEAARRQLRLDIAAQQGMAALAADWVPNMVHPDRRNDRELVAEITAMVTSYTVEQYQGQIHALLHRVDERPTLGAISCPALVACGSHDAWSPVPQHEAIADAIKDSEFRIIANAGHMVAMEQPDATNALLSEWLSEATRPGS